MKIIVLVSLTRPQPTRFNHSVTMHYKRKKSKFKKSSELDRNLQGWTYQGKIAREVINRREFKQQLLTKTFD
jgi:hypothetical protein